MYEKTHNYAKAALDSVVLIGSATSEENDIWLTNYNTFLKSVNIKIHTTTTTYRTNERACEVQRVGESEKKTCKTYFMWLTVLLFLQMNLQYLFMSLFSSRLS